MHTLQKSNRTSGPQVKEPEQRGSAVDDADISRSNSLWQSLALRPAAIQPKLNISQPGDPHEQEADHIADQVASTTERNDHAQLQTKPVGASDSVGNAVPPVVDEALHSSGTPMDQTTRGFMESHLGQDFSQVRVHADTRAAEAASAIAARAYTVNRDIVFGAGEYAPATSEGKKLLAHELTHVVQQSGDAQSNKGSVVQRQTEDDVFTTADATAVKDKWAKEGASSESDIARQLDTYKNWKNAYNKAVKAAKKAKPRALTDEQLATADTWVNTYESHEQWKALGSGQEPADPGTAPAELGQLGGNPPTPAYEKIKQYDVTVPGGSKYSYTDHVKSANTVTDTGVGSLGKTGGKEKINDVFDKAGVGATDTEIVKKVFTVLSNLEGKFDAINTYDRGYISAGFIQFITGAGGNESLAKVLRSMKEKNPDDFTTNFHNLGIDVDSKGIVVVDPKDGKVLHGGDAVQKVISDKRLTAVFQEAGKSDSYQQAQARIAYEMYYVPDKSFSIKLKVKETDPESKKKTKVVTLSGKYSEVLASEAGKVAIVDRGVQRGTAGGHGSGGAAGRFLDACQEVVDRHNLTDPTVADLAKYESEIVPRLVNRYKVLSDKSLSQPAAAPADTPSEPVKEATEEK